MLYTTRDFHEDIHIICDLVNCMGFTHVWRVGVDKEVVAILCPAAQYNTAFRQEISIWCCGLLRVA